MAARIKKFHTDEIRAKIQTSQLINRLTDHALKGTEMSPSQVRAIEVLLRKSLADLSAVTVDGKLDHNVVGEIVFKGLNG